MQAGTALEQLLGQRRDGWLSQQRARLWPVQQGHGRLRQRPQRHRATIAQNQLCLLRLPGNVERVTQHIRSKLGHDPADRPSRLLQRLQRRTQPGLVTGRHPDRSVFAGLRLERKVQLRRLIEQLVFQQTFQHGTQARRSALLEQASPQRTARQLDAMPGQLVGTHQRHHLDRVVGLRQQRQRYPRLLAHHAPVRTEQIVVQVSRSGRKGDDESGHTQVLPLIVRGPPVPARHVCAPAFSPPYRCAAPAIAPAPGSAPPAKCHALQRNGWPRRARLP